MMWLQLDLKNRLMERIHVNPVDFEAEMIRAETRYGTADWIPQTDPSCLKPGTYFLTSVSKSFQRSYQKKE